MPHPLLPALPGLIRSAWRIPPAVLCIGLVMAIACIPPAPAQDMPTAEEMQEMMEAMSEMQEVMDNLDPESRQLIDQMMANPQAGIAIGSVDDDAQPARDDAKLAAISTAALTAPAPRSAAAPSTSRSSCATPVTSVVRK